MVAAINQRIHQFYTSILLSNNDLRIHLAPLGILDSNASEKWKRFFLAGTNYALATELGNKSEAVQVATLLTVIGDEGGEV